MNCPRCKSHYVHLMKCNSTYMAWCRSDNTYSIADSEEQLRQQWANGLNVYLSNGKKFERTNQ